jgi:hypothetical protein
LRPAPPSPDDSTALMLPSTSFGIVSAKLIGAALAPTLAKTSLEILS